MHEITTFFFFIGQDLPVALIWFIGAIALYFTARNSDRIIEASGAAFGRFGSDQKAARKAMLVCAIGAGLVSLLISWLVFHFFPLSIDEKMVHFDAEIFSRGRLAAPFPEHLRDMSQTFIRLFVKTTPDRSFSHSMYLPLNAALHLPFISLGIPTLIDALMVVGTIVVTYDILRKLLPDHPDAALFGAVMLASAPQVLLTGATVYSMTAHLFIDMLWMRAMMSDRRLAWCGAAILALIASGLHQWAYFPLFAVGFLWEWFRKRDHARLLVAAAPTAIAVLVWSRYRSYSLPDFWSGHEPYHGDQTLIDQAKAFGSALAPSIALILEHLKAPNEHQHQASLMPYNIFRLVFWQNPLLWLGLIFGYPLWKHVSILRGVILSMLAMTVITTLFVPFQGHGWGYRYLHHFLGGVSLCAAFGYLRFKQEADQMSLIVRNMVWRLRFWTLATLCGSLPFLVAISGLYNWPYWKVEQEIANVNADFVILDMIDLPYSVDPLNNNAFLDNRPVRVIFPNLKPWMVQKICSLGTMHIHSVRAPFGSSDEKRKAELPEFIYNVMQPRYWQQQGCRVVDREGKLLPPLP